MTGAVGRLIFPCALALSAALLAKSSSAVGDGFSAGAVAGLAGVVQYACLDHNHAARLTGARWAWGFVVCGLMTVLVLGLGPAFVGVPPVTHLPRPGEAVRSFGMLKLHTVLLFELGIAVLVYGAIVGIFDRLFPPLHGDEP